MNELIHEWTNECVKNVWMDEHEWTSHLISQLIQ